MSFHHDPRNDPDVTKLPCRIGTGDCTDLADGYCEECGKPTCRSCAIEVNADGGYLLVCVYCHDDIENSNQKEQQERKAA